MKSCLEIEEAVQKALEKRDAEWIAYTGMPAPSDEFCLSYWKYIGEKR